MTGKERLWINPNKGLVKIFERNLDIIVSRFLYPHSSEVRPHLAALAPLSRPPLGAWYGHGNHDYFGRDTGNIRMVVAAVIYFLKLWPVVLLLSWLPNRARVAR
jgi:hypothetical protein